jgi:Raf kinase inhibitor-like YbhB/YbcL family protein
MRFIRSSRSIVVPVILLAISAGVSAQQRGGGGGGGRGGGGRGRGNAFANLTLVTTAWPDGGMIPLRYTQAGPEISPAIQWSAAPAGTASFVLMLHDADALAANTSTDDFLHWMLWNIPATATGLPQGMPDGFELPDGMRQISVSGSRYRGPGASATGPIHHYVLELYALDTMLDIKVTPQGPQEPNPNVQAIRTSIVQAMAGHIRGKAAYFGLFRRPQ